MGCSFSCSSPPPLETVRVVHLNGYVEDFGYPVTASEVTGNPKRHFVCTRAQLASGGRSPLKPCTTLEPGNVYFLIPYSTIQSDVSPMDLAAIARKLNKIAKTSQSQASKSPLRNSKPVSSPVWTSPARSPNRFSWSPTRSEPECGLAAYGLQRSPKARSWKPVLDTIREKSFGRRSESDLREKHLELEISK
ncbi:hypothetical protein RHMOL_Rhmol01G0121000 [Rhododendron molle]|uniref:Uncharacterized protein n=1 Tax=Rhododendron molle TaxID=49168 RepID=A0ACC0Q0A4_RHOML|nr:hypothetical protein RHMOL_Rhmol01G0121000 [Rhododendron molle]